MEIKIERLESVLSGILSDRYQKKITVTLQEGNENSSKDFNGDRPASVHVRRVSA